MEEKIEKIRQEKCQAAVEILTEIGGTWDWASILQDVVKVDAVIEAYSDYVKMINAIHDACAKSIIKEISRIDTMRMANKTN